MKALITCLGLSVLELPSNLDRSLIGVIRLFHNTVERLIARAGKDLEAVLPSTFADGSLALMRIITNGLGLLVMPPSLGRMSKSA